MKMHHFDSENKKEYQKEVKLINTISDRLTIHDIRQLKLFSDPKLFDKGLKKLI